MADEKTKVRAPELTGGYWVNSEPLAMESLRGGPVLLDFWDYTCVDCIRTLAYVTEWHRRYKEHGLTVVGVHAPGERLNIASTERFYALLKSLLAALDA